MRTTISPRDPSATQVWQVVVIDDSPDDRAEVRRLLLQGSERRYKFAEAETGAAGVRAVLDADGGPPDCVVLDYDLPDTNAVEVLAALAGPDGVTACPVVVLTGATGHEHTRAVLRAGAQDYLGKAWMTPESLTRAVENAAERWAMARVLSDRETALRSIEDRFRMAARVAGLAVAEIDYATDRVHLSPESAALFGLPNEPAAVPRATIHALFHPDDQPMLAQLIAASHDPTGTGELQLDHRIIRPDGQVRWHRVHKQVSFVGGRPAQALLALFDITERERAAAALRESQKRLDHAYRAAKLGTWDWDITTNAARWTAAAWELFTGSARTGPQVTHEMWRDCIHPDDRHRAEAVINAVVSGPYRDEFRVRYQDGQEAWLESAGEVIRDEHGRVVRMLGTVRNITERKLGEEALRDADRRKDEFLATLAHELRNPLAPVRNAVAILRATGPAIPEVQWARDVIDRQTQMLARLIDDLMDVSRINQGKLELKREHTDLKKIVEGAVETSRPLIDEMDHTLAVTLPSRPVVVYADATRLPQVLMNLLNNAAKYTERGGRIDLRIELQGSDVVVSVTDTGIGISPDKLSTIFEMFSQVEGALSRSQGGLGIGLHLVKRLVEMHDGRIEARSGGPGTGSEFVVRLPIVVEQTYPLSASGDGVKATPTAGLRILVVDDNRDAAESSAMLLKFMGNHVQMAHDGEAAVAAARAFRPQVVLCDIGLPTLNGYEVCRQIRTQAWAETTILIAVTGWGQDDVRRQAAEAGFDHHMIKPVDPDALMTLLAGLDAVKG